MSGMLARVPMLHFKQTTTRDAIANAIARRRCAEDTLQQSAVRSGVLLPGSL